MNQRRDHAATPPSNWLLLIHGAMGSLLGFPLAILLSGCLLHYVLGHGQGQDSAETQIAMWSVPAIWIAIISVSFLARNAKGCLKWLLAANLIAAALLYFAIR